MTTETLAEAQTRMQGAVEALDRDLAGVRTGRANPALVENLIVNYQGVQLPLKQLSQISAADARLLVIQPWDPTSIDTISRAIQASDLGMQPNSDGRVIRLNVPPLTEERRRDIVRMVRKRVEEAKVAARNVRRDALDRLRRMERDGEISQDVSRRAREQLQKQTDAAVAEIDARSKRKEEEVMAV